MRTVLLLLVLLALSAAAAAPASASESGGAAPAGDSPPASGPVGGSGGAGPGGPVAVPNPGPAGIPSAYLRWYRSAGGRFGVDWRLLAAIGSNESDHGRSREPGVASGLNTARCCAGPMQLCRVRTCGDAWHHYGLDADADGSASVYDPPDAIFAAAMLVRDLRAQVGPSARLLLAAYTAGPGAVARYRGVPPFRPTRAYVRAGLAYMARL